MALEASDNLTEETNKYHREVAYEETESEAGTNQTA